MPDWQQLRVRLVGEWSSYRDAMNETDKAFESMMGHWVSSVNQTSYALGTLGYELKALQQSLQGFLTNAVRTFESFEAGMMRVQAVTGITGDAFEELRQKALKIGEDTTYTASEIADAMYKIGSAGVSGVEELDNITKAVVNLSESTGRVVKLDTASQMLLATLKSFQIPTEQAATVTDKFTQAVNSSALEMEDFVHAMPVAGIMSRFGQSLDTTIAEMELLAERGLHGREAMHSITAAIQQLVTPSQQAAAFIRALGIETVDASGKIRQLPDIARDLRSALNLMKTDTSKYSEAARILAVRMGLIKSSTKDAAEIQKAIAQAFQKGGKEAELMAMKIIAGQRGMHALALSVEDADGKLSEFIRNLQNVDNTASKTAAVMMDDLFGSFEQVRGSMETFMVTIAQPLVGTVKFLSDTFRELLNLFSKLPTFVKQTVSWFLVLTTAVAALSSSLTMTVSLSLRLVAAFVGIIDIMPKLTALWNGFNITVKAGGLAALATMGKLLLIVTTVAAVVQAYRYFTGEAERAKKAQDDLEKNTLKAARANRQDAEESANLAKEYEALQKKAKLTADQKDRMEQISKRLVELNPQLLASYDQETGKIKIQTDKLNLLNKERERALRLEEELNRTAGQRKRKEEVDKIYSNLSDRQALAAALGQEISRGVQQIPVSMWQNPGKYSPGWQNRRYSDNPVTELRKLEPNRNIEWLNVNQFPPEAREILKRSVKEWYVSLSKGIDKDLNRVGQLLIENALAWNDKRWAKWYSDKYGIPLPSTGKPDEPGGGGGGGGGSKETQWQTLGKQLDLAKAYYEATKTVEAYREYRAILEKIATLKVIQPLNKDQLDLINKAKDGIEALQNEFENMRKKSQQARNEFHAALLQRKGEDFAEDEVRNFQAYLNLLTRAVNRTNEFVGISRQNHHQAFMTRKALLEKEEQAATKFYTNLTKLDRDYNNQMLTDREEALAKLKQKFEDDSQEAEQNLPGDRNAGRLQSTLERLKRNYEQAQTILTAEYDVKDREAAQKRVDAAKDLQVKILDIDRELNQIRFERGQITEEQLLELEKANAQAIYDVRKKNIEDQIKLIQEAQLIWEAMMSWTSTPNFDTDPTLLKLKDTLKTLKDALAQLQGEKGVTDAKNTGKAEDLARERSKQSLEEQQKALEARKAAGETILDTYEEEVKLANQEAEIFKNDDEKRQKAADRDLKLASLKATHLQAIADLMGVQIDYAEEMLAKDDLGEEVLRRRVALIRQEMENRKADQQFQAESENKIASLYNRYYERKLDLIENQKDVSIESIRAQLQAELRLAEAESANLELRKEQLDALKRYIEELKRALGDIDQEIDKKVRKPWEEFVKRMTDSFIDGLTDIIMGARSFSDVMKSLFNDLLRYIIQQILRAVILGEDAFSGLGKKGQMSGMGGKGGLGDLASYVPMIGAGIALGGLFKGLKFDSGGYVPGPVGAPQAAIVHSGEYVMSNALLKEVLSKTAQPAAAGAGGINIQGPINVHGVTNVDSFIRELGMAVYRKMPVRNR